MGVPTVRADYENLGKIAQTFNQYAANTRQTLQQLRQRLEILQNGDWVGKGATAFYKEMNSEVIPTIARLSNALEASNQAVLKIRQIMQVAEEETARLFRANVVGQATGGGSGGGQIAGGTPVGAISGLTVSAQNPLLVQNPNTLFSDRALSRLIDTYYAGGDSTALRGAMEELSGNPRGTRLNQALTEVARLRGRPLNEIQAEYTRFQQVRAQAQDNINQRSDLEEIPALSIFHGDFMGTTPQLRYGSIVGQAFGIDPVFGALLNPTGGMVGPGNLAYAPGNDSAIGYHGVVHDAAGYLYNYHNTGPGYNYLGRESSDTSSPLTGQVSGVRYWTEKIYPLTSYGFRAVDGVVDTTRSTARAVGSFFQKLF